MEPVTPRERGRLARTLVGITATLSLLIGAGGAYAYVAYGRAGSNIRVAPTVTAFGGTPVPSVSFGPCVNRVCNYLILGSDSRAGLPRKEQVQFGTNQDIGGSNRSDVIILVHIDPTTEKATLLSFPRDLWVNIPGRGHDKINTAFEGGIEHGGPQLVTKTVEDLTGIHINHYLYVDLAGFQRIVQTLGGVDICIPSNLVNTPDGRIFDILTGLNVRPGCQRLNGYQALAYVRTRHLPCDYIPDFSRIGRQQQFLRAVLNRLLSPSEITKAPSLIGPIVSNLVTDPGFPLADVIYLVGQLRGISTGAVDFRTVPGTAVNIYPQGVLTSIVRMDPSAQELFRAIRENRPLPPGIGTALEQTPVSEANVVAAAVDHASAGKVDGVESVLAQSGFDVAPGVVQYSALPGLARVKGSAIAYGPGHLEDAQVVAKYFPGLKMVQAPKGALSSGSVAVVVTDGYRPQPVGSQPSTGCQVPTP